MSELMKKATKETCGKVIRSKGVPWETHLLKNLKHQHVKLNRVLSLSLRYLSIAVVYVPIALKKNQTRMMKLMRFRETMDPDDINAYYTNNLERYVNWPNYLKQVCCSCYDFASRNEI